MPYEHHIYTMETVGNVQFCAYPEQYNGRWEPKFINNEGKTVNEERIPCPKANLPKSWRGYNPVSRRGLQYRIKALDDAAKKAIIVGAMSREDFHDQDKIHPEELFGYLCEVRFYTGKDCKQHLVKGPDNKTVGMPDNQHWVWDIDVAPRGYVCPRALERHLKGNVDGDSDLDGCDILLLNQPPSEEWVLAQTETDDEGTEAGRATKDICLQGQCCKCAGLIVDKNHRLRTSQAGKYVYEGEGKLTVQPWMYKPFNGGKSCHPLLQVDGLYHEWELRKFQGVPAKDIWLPNVPRGKNDKGEAEKGRTLAEWQGTKDIVTQDTPEDHEDFEKEMLKMLSIERTPET